MSIGANFVQTHHTGKIQIIARSIHFGYADARDDLLWPPMQIHSIFRILTQSIQMERDRLTHI